MLNRRNFLKACGVGVVASLGLVGKAKPKVFQGRITDIYINGKPVESASDTICYDFGDGRVMARKFSFIDGELRIEDVTAKEFFKQGITNEELNAKGLGFFDDFPEYYAPVKQLTLAETKKLFPKFREV